MQLSQENFDALIGNFPANGATLVIIGIVAWLAETEMSTLVDYAHVVVLACLAE